MAGKPTYTEAQKAQVYVVLASNDGNVKRTARDTGIPEATVRRWRDSWVEDGPPRQEEIELALDDFTDAVKTVRDAALAEIHRLILNHEIKGAALVTAFGVLTDKIDRAAGLRPDAPPEQPALNPTEIGQLLAGFFTEARSLSQARQADIIEAELVEPPALPAGK